ncbi:MAG: hypothetical protein K6G94_01805 [Kiritimatiellae bacterium]|nr:hypothetical protein [Kiritimatiellia bacterium]
MKQWGLRIGGDVYHGKNIRSLSDARREKRRMEEADWAYDIPNPPKRSIVWREVGEWQPMKEGAK